MKTFSAENKVTDYIDSDKLHDIMSSVKVFGSFDSYNQLDDMTIVTTKANSYQGVGPYGAVSVSRRFWKFVKADNIWKAYEMTESGEKIGEMFPLQDA